MFQVGHSSPLKYSQSIHDLSHIPERDRWSKKQGNNETDFEPIPNNVCLCGSNINNIHSNTSDLTNTSTSNLKSSQSNSKHLQLCKCFMNNIAKTTSQLSVLLNLSHHSTANVDKFTKDGKINTKTVESYSKTSNLNDLIRPRKLKLDKTLAKYKLNKSLPVSPVSEERQFSDYIELEKEREQNRKSFSYFIDFNKKLSTDEGFRKICSDIEKFSEDFNKKFEQMEQKFEIQIESSKEINKDDDDGNFSSDSLEDYCFLSIDKKSKTSAVPPRRCISNNEISRFQDEYFDEFPKSESFYLDPHIRTSQDSILSDEPVFDYDFCAGKTKSYTNSMESILSNESECKSAPLEMLFAPQKKSHMIHSQSVPKNMSDGFNLELSSSLPSNYYAFGYEPPICMKESTKIVKASMRTCQTQTDFATPQEIVTKKVLRGSEEFQRKLLKFEQKNPIAFFVENHPKTMKQSKHKENIPVNNIIGTEMYIPSLESKNKQYKSKFSNVLNNKPEINTDIYENGAKASKNGNTLVLSTINFDKNTNKNHVQETSSLDRHLFNKSLLYTERVCHKPPKAVRRHNSSRIRRAKTTYEYIKKEDFNMKKCNKTKDALNNKVSESTESSIELNFKEKNLEQDLESSFNSEIDHNVNSNSPNHKDKDSFLNELYDSLDKKIVNSKMEYDSLELNLNSNDCDKFYDSLELKMWSKNANYCLENVFKKPSTSYQNDKIASTLENIKILNEIQKKIHKINNLVDIVKKNMTSGKVRALSSMYESMTTSQSYYNDLTKLQAMPLRYRKRNLSLPSFVERRLNFEKIDNKNVKCNRIGAEVTTEGNCPTEEGEY